MHSINRYPNSQSTQSRHLNHNPVSGKRDQHNPPILYSTSEINLSKLAFPELNLREPKQFTLRRPNDKEKSNKPRRWIVILLSILKQSDVLLLCCIQISRNLLLCCRNIFIDFIGNHIVYKIYKEKQSVCIHCWKLWGKWESFLKYKWTYCSSYPINEFNKSGQSVNHCEFTGPKPYIHSQLETGIIIWIVTSQTLTWLDRRRWEK